MIPADVAQALRQVVPPDVAQLARFAMLVLFVVLGLRVAARGPGATTRRRRINGLLAWLLALHGAVALLQRESWPFALYPMMANDARIHDDLRRMTAFRAVDAGGREHRLDPLALSPLYSPAVEIWFEKGFPQATDAERQDVGRFLLERAEDARVRREAGRRVGNERLLGRLAAPDSYPPYPPLEGPPPAEPFDALRVYRLYWRPAIFAADSTRVDRRLLLEYRRR